MRNIVAAIPEAISHRRSFEEFDAHLRRDMSEQVEQWEKEFIEWEKQPKPSPCLFDTPDQRKPFILLKLPLD